MKEVTHHGGALGTAIGRFGGTRADWLDLSTGINPSPPALPRSPPGTWERLPEREAEDRLRQAARALYGTPDEASIVLAPGTQSLISLWPHLFAPTDAAVVSPTYGEHEAALREAGHRVRRIAAPQELPGETRLLVVANPNNPDGRRFARTEFLRLADELAARGGFLVVDEAFMDVDPAESLAPQAGRDGLLILRSFGKFFGLAGLRLGFALTGPVTALRLERRLGPWAVSGPALALAAALMEDGPLVDGLRAQINAQATRLRAALDEAGLAIEGGTALFTLVRHPEAHRLFEALAQRFVLTRPFAERADWLRFGNPADEAAAGRLRQALGEAQAEIGG